MAKSLYIILPDELNEKLREYCFKNKTTKKAVVLEALGNKLGAKPVGKEGILTQLKKGNTPF